MKDDKIIFILLLCILFLVGLIFFCNNVRDNDLDQEKLTGWNLYKNEDLGFSMNIPSEVATVKRCPDNEMVSAPLRVFEEKDNGVIYIVPEYYYDADWSQEEHSFTKECTKTEYTLEMLESENVQKPFLGWKMIIEDIDEDNIESSIKKNFGSTCIVDSIKEEQNGDYSILIKGEDWDEENFLGETGCLVNYFYKIVYSEERNKLMSLVLGQECTFETDPKTQPYYCYDEEMINSFSFDK